MLENKKCKCPLCEQRFTPENGMTPEEHIAKGIIRAYREMQEVPHDFVLPCPRCGQERMNVIDISQNAISSYSDVYICYMCKINEALRESKNNILSLTGWWIVSELLKSIRGVKCKNYIPEKGNPYPLCNNPACEESETCNISAHMKEDAYSQYNK